MRRKLFTPLNFGAFQLEHRLVVDAGRSGLHSDRTSRVRNSMVRAGLGGGLLIHEPNLFLGAEELTWDETLPQLRERYLLEAARTARQTVIARLDAGPPAWLRSRTAGPPDFTYRDIRHTVEAYAEAAVRAKAIGFDGIELDGSAGTLTDQFLLSGTDSRSDRYGGAAAQRLSFLIELVDALSHVFGSDRIGVRLSPFRDDGLHLRSGIFEDALRSLSDHEVAYVHLADPAAFVRRCATPRPPSPASKALRQAFPGILMSTAEQSIAHANEVVDSRWADAACLFEGALAAVLDGQAELR